MTKTILTVFFFRDTVYKQYNGTLIPVTSSESDYRLRNDV